MMLNMFCFRSMNFKRKEFKRVKKTLPEQQAEIEGLKIAMLQLHNRLESFICAFIQQQEDNEENGEEKNTLVSGEGMNQLD